MKRHGWKTVLSFVLLAILLSGMTAPVRATESVPLDRRARVSDDTLRVLIPIPNNAGYVSVSEDGTVSGYYVDYLTAISKYTHWRYEYIIAESNEALLAHIEAMDYDLIAGVVYLPEYDENYFNYPIHTIGAKNYIVAAEKDHPTLINDDLQTLLGTNALVSSTDHELEDRFKNYCYSNGLGYVDDAAADSKRINFIHTDGQKRVEELAAHKGDIILTSDAFALAHNLAAVAVFGMDPIYIAAPDNSTSHLSRLDAAIEALEEADPALESRLYQQYFAANNERILTFTAEETAFLQSAPHFTVAGLKNGAPFCYEHQGESKGIIIEVLRQIEAQTGDALQFEIKLYDSFRELETAASQGAYQIAPSILEAGTASALHTATRSTAFYTDQFEIYRNQSTDRFPDDAIIAVPSKLLPENEVVSTLFPNSQIIYRNTPEACLDAVNSGMADFTVLLSETAAYYLASSAKTQVSLYQTLDWDGTFSLVYEPGTDTRAITIINKCIRDLNQSALSEYLLTALTEESHPQTLQEFMAAHWPKVISILVVMILLLILTLLLIQKNRLLKKANHATGNFLAQISHDIRTPMNIIIHMTQFARENDNPPQTIHCLDKIEQNSSFLLGLVNDVLDLSKVESGKIELHYEPYSFAEFQSYLASIVQPLCEQKNLSFTCSCNTDCSFAVMLDRLRINQVFFNLVSNAVKFTPAGGHIEVDIQMIPIGNHKVALTTIIRDNGIGMSAEFQKHLFEPFAQENRLKHATTPGTGLGLAIVKQMVDLMNCTITVASAPDCGTTFTLSGEFERAALPVPSADAGLPAPKTNIQGARILVCEDHEMNREIIGRLLQKQDCSVTMAENGLRGVALFAASAPFTYQAILMDIQMPKLDGLSATAQIRQLDRPDAKTVPIIAMTANAYAEDVAASFAAGMNAHLSKPIEPQKLYETLTQQIQPQ